MNRPLPDCYKNLPSELSMDYRMNADTLWVVWFKTMGYETDGRIAHCFVLSSPDKQGVKDILSKEGTGVGKDTFFCMLSLTQIRDMVKSLSNSKLSFLSKLPSWLGGREKYLIVEEKNGVLETTLTEAGSEEECYVQILEHNRDAKIVWVAPISPLLKLQGEMEEILDKEDYRRVWFDRRPASPGHPEDWFYYMRNPELYPGVKESREYFKANPGRWKEAEKEVIEMLRKDLDSIDSIWKDKD